MKDIKQKPQGGKPKVLERAAKVPKTATKDVWLKEKVISELKETPFASQSGESSNAPATRAGEQMVSGAESTAKKAASLSYHGGKKLAQKTARTVKEHKNLRAEKETVREQASEAVSPHLTDTVSPVTETTPDAPLPGEHTKPAPAGKELRTAKTASGRKSASRVQ